jgi:hypothetical protein
MVDALEAGLAGADDLHTPLGRIRQAVLRHLDVGAGQLSDFLDLGALEKNLGIRLCRVICKEETNLPWRGVVWD